jgi:transcriptional regulator with XRE-family HTH domain
MRYSENERALRLVERLMKVGGPLGRRAEKMRNRLAATPMAVILAEVPPAGGSVIEKAKKLGVSRQTYYYWLDGTTRPNIIMARKIHRLTGIEIDKIRGREGE